MDYREEFLQIWHQHVSRPGSEKLLDWLDNKTDFFSAPASTRFHGACDGGLCMHSLNVYHALHDGFFTEGESLSLIHIYISAEYGIPIINKRISVTPIAMLLGACPDADPVDFAKALDAAGKKVGVNFVGGYTALVHKGFSAGDRRLIESIPRALAETDIVCSSVNIGATKAGLNMEMCIRDSA